MNPKARPPRWRPSIFTNALAFARPLWTVTSTELARIRRPTADAFSTPPLRCRAGAPPSIAYAEHPHLRSPVRRNLHRRGRPGPRPRALLAPFTASICDVRFTSSRPDVDSSLGLRPLSAVYARSQDQPRMPVQGRTFALTSTTPNGRYWRNCCLPRATATGCHGLVPRRSVRYPPVPFESESRVQFPAFGRNSNLRSRLARSRR